MRLVVIGAGAAGTAAAWRAARGKAAVTVVHARPGATSLYSGALDLVEWSGADSRSSQPLSGDALAFVTALGVVSVPTAACLLATDTGVLRTARAHDAALLDLLPLLGSNATIAVADVPAFGWDAPGLAASFGASNQARGTHFVARAVPGFLSGKEARLRPFDIASLLDDPARVDALAAALESAGRPPDGWIVGPWLGTTGSAVESLRLQVRCPIGEVVTAPDGPAGARFEWARDELLGALGVRAISQEVVALRRSGAGWLVECRDAPPLDAEAVIVAVGGVSAGGIRLKRVTDATGPFSLSLEAPLTLAVDGTPLIGLSSSHGPTLSRHGLGTLKRVGIVTAGAAVPGAPGLYAAGDVVADRPRTLLAAVEAGVEAARAALTDQ